MKNLLLIFIFSFVFFLNISAQIDQARKIDEVENTNCDDYRARMDMLLTEVSNSPDSKGYVFIYEGKLKTFAYDKNGKSKGIEYISPEVGRAKEIIHYFKNHLSFRNYSANKIVFIEAGFREKYIIEFWIVPAKADLPKPSPDLKKIKQRKQTRKLFGFCGEM